VDFKEATDRLTERVTLADIAEACGSHPNSIDRARLEPDSKSYRSPPREWKPALAHLARAHGLKMLALAEELSA
jgi:hypothetical protein